MISWLRFYISGLLVQNEVRRIENTHKIPLTMLCVPHATQRQKYEGVAVVFHVLWLKCSDGYTVVAAIAEFNFGVQAEQMSAWVHIGTWANKASRLTTKEGKFLTRIL